MECWGPRGRLAKSLIDPSDTTSPNSSALTNEGAGCDKGRGQNLPPEADKQLAPPDIQLPFNHSTMVRSSWRCVSASALSQRNFLQITRNKQICSQTSCVIILIDVRYLIRLKTHCYWVWFVLICDRNTPLTTTKPWKEDKFDSILFPHVQTQHK